jgi:hypothetical protein
MHTLAAGSRARRRRNATASSPSTSHTTRNAQGCPRVSLANHTAASAGIASIRRAYEGTSRPVSRVAQIVDGLRQHGTRQLAAGVSGGAGARLVRQQRGVVQEILRPCHRRQRRHRGAGRSRSANTAARRPALDDEPRDPGGVRVPAVGHRPLAGANRVDHVAVQLARRGDGHPVLSSTRLRRSEARSRAPGRRRPAREPPPVSPAARGS